MKRRALILAGATKLQSDLRDAGSDLEIISSIMHRNKNWEGRASREDMARIRQIIDRPLIETPLGIGHRIVIAGRKGIIRGESNCKTCWRVQFDGHIPTSIRAVHKSKVQDDRTP